MSPIHVAKSGKKPTADGSQDSLEFDDKWATLAGASDDRGEERQVVNQLLDAYEQYRKLVAYEIHDGVVQCLTGALINLEASVRILGTRFLPQPGMASTEPLNCSVTASQMPAR